MARLFDLDAIIRDTLGLKTQAILSQKCLL